MTFSSSTDLLNLVLAACLIFLTVFLCVAMSYLISVMSLVRKIASKIENGVDKAEEVIDIARDKLKGSATYLMLLGELAKKGVEFLQSRKERSGETIKETIKRRYASRKKKKE